MNRNLILNTDSYKASHFLQYPPGTTKVYSYIESRGSNWDSLVFFGLQMFLKEYLTKPITQADIQEAAEFFPKHGLPFNREGWEYILRTYGGFLPIQIKAVAEGTILPIKNVLATVCNTDPLVPWLTSYMETAILRAIWYPTTVATNSYHCKQVILEYLEKTSDDPMGQIGFKLHDFGARGVSSQESAAIGGAAHLVNFMGSDTVAGIIAARDYYSEPMAAFSIPAAEHSTITAWGRDHEVDAYANMLDHFAKKGSLVAVVSDSYDIHAALEKWGSDPLRAQVMDSGACVVIRPDSGHPATIVFQCVLALAKKFGSSLNAKGYTVLNPCVRVIQGDGINIESIREILRALKGRGYSADNVAFGMGGGLLQQLDRDTLKFAMKCSAIEVDREWRDVWKEPSTDRGKTSKRGRLALITENGRWETVPAAGNAWRDELKVVFENGRVVKETTFREVRERANRPMLGN